MPLGYGRPVQAEPFVRAALAAIDEAGDPCEVRAILEAALTAAAPLERLPRPPNAKKRVVWAARQLAIAADQPARAYERLRELVAALWEPLATSSEAITLGLPSQPTLEFAAGQAAVAGPPRSSAPAPEVAAAMAPPQLIEMLAPAPRVLAREIAVTLDVDPAVLLAESSLARRVLGIRAIKQASLGKYADQLAALIVAVADAEPSAVLRFEAIAICVPAAESLRSKVVAALIPYIEHAEHVVRARALDGMRELKLPLGDERLASLLHDSSAAVRVAAARSVIRGPFPASVEMALVSRLTDDDPRVRAAALGAMIRTPSLHGPALVEPLREVLRRSEEVAATAGPGRELARTAARDAVYLLGRLGAIARDAGVDVALAIASAIDPRQTGEALAAIARGGAADPRILGALNDAVTGPRSDASRAAAMVLESLGAPVPELSIEARVVRAATELASSDRVIVRAGLFEAKRLGRAAISLIPAIKALGDQLAVDESLESRSLLALARDALIALGVPAGELPQPPGRLEAHRGISPRELEVHGAYAIGEVGDARGLWDNGTGRRLFVIDHARALAFIPGRAEIAGIRIDTQWHFERYAVPSGERLASIDVPDALTYGAPIDIAIAGDLATVWCSDPAAAYRFHVKLGDPDRVIDEVPVLGVKPSEAGSRRQRRDP